MSDLIDTTIAVDYLRDRQEAVDFVEAKVTSEEITYFSVVTRAELYAGIRSGEEEKTEDFLSLFVEVNVDRTIAQKAGDYLRQHSKSHNLELGDAIIAATVHSLGLRLVTLNDKHFPMEDIDVLSPY